MSGSLDAGRYSLAGYLYQLAGSVAEALKLLRSPELDDSSCAAEFALELYGQDAAHSEGAGPVKLLELIQYKFSTKPAENLIGEPDLIEILQAFRASRKAALGDGYKVVQFRLVTNRRLNVTRPRPCPRKQHTMRNMNRWTHRGKKKSVTG